jgi:dihydrofolate synthase / folylpolyglutamate synthase
VLNYTQSTVYLESLTNYEKSPAARYDASNFDLRRMELLLADLGNPQTGRKTVHIAGTKGKGSTAAIVASILRTAGYCCGLFTSPHLYSWQERINVGGRPIPQKDFARLVNLARPLVEKINQSARFGCLTTFEVLTAMAFLHFRERGAGFQVLETGMGGRLDATNVVTPDVCVLTSISLDHTQVLGSTLAKIAGEKAGIIKPGCTVVSAPQDPAAGSVIRARCGELAGQLIQAGEDIKWVPISGNLTSQTFQVAGQMRKYRVRLPLLGDFQMENAALAIAAIETLQRQGVNITYKDIIRGVSRVKWPARMQILGLSPLIIIDGAHNAYSIRRVVESIRKHFVYTRAYVIFGSSNDKDIAGMAGELEGFADRLILTSSRHARAAPVDNLHKLLGNSKLNISREPDAGKSLSAALSMAGKGDLILATGSLFLAAEIQMAFTETGKFV